MSQSVSVGFAPAVTPVISNGSAAPAEPQGEGVDLFATLLALLGAEPPPAREAIAALPDIPVAVPPLPLPDLAGTAPETIPAPQPALETDSSTTDGHSLLKSLGDALIALDAALDAGRPPDPALEKKLDEQLEAVAAYLGLTPPAPPAVAPGIAALASGNGILPAQPAAPGPAAPPAAPGTTPPPAGSTLAAAAPTVVPPPSAPLDLALASIEPDALPPAPQAAPASYPVPAETPAPAQAPLPEPLRKLAKLVGELGQRLEAQAPELAQKLEAFADRLLAGKLPPAIASALTAAADGEGGAEPAIQRIIDALGSPRPATAPVPAPQPFIAPALQLPSSLPGPHPEPVEGPPTGPAPARLADAPEKPSAPELSRPEPEAKAAPPAPATKPEPAPLPDPAASSATVAAAAPPSGARAVHAAYQAPVQQLNLPQVAFEIVRQFEAGHSRFQIRLDPPELGRIDVKLDVDRSGTINARMVVERPETLDLMQRDQRALQQALQQAGLDGSKTSLEFSLRQNPFAQQQSMGDGRGQQPAMFGDAGPAADEPAEIASQSTLYRGTASVGGVNLFV